MEECSDDAIAVRTHRYMMPVTLQDLPPTEAMHQVFDSLQNLNSVIDDVFSRLHNQIATERAKITEVINRVGRAQQLVGQISDNVNKATTVYSMTKYPAPAHSADFQHLHDCVDQHGLDHPLRTKYHLKPMQRLAMSERVETLGLFAKLTAAPESSKSDKGMNDEESEGLGRLPSYLPSISSVLLFNSSKNPYKRYVSINNLEGTSGVDREKEDFGLAAAPTSLVDGAQLPTFAGVDFGYSPHLGNVPTFDLPANLPLAMVADISFGDTPDGVSSIAPSIAQMPSLLSVEDWRQKQSTSKKKQPKQTTTKKPARSIPTREATPQVTPAASARSSVPVPPVSKVPIPPMAPVSKVPVPPMAPVAAVAPPSSGSGGSGGNVKRNALLDQIRNPSVKLRKVGDVAKRSKKPKPASSGGGDMMSVLRNALALRRKVTSDQMDKPSKKSKAFSTSSSGMGFSDAPREQEVDAEEFDEADWE